MFFVLLVSASAVLAVVLSRRSPRTLTAVGLVTIVVGGIAIAIGELSGNLLLFFLGGMSTAFGMVVLLGRLVSAVLAERDANRFL